MLTTTSTSATATRQESFHIKQDDKFFSKLLSKEEASTGGGNPSFRVYYGDVSGAVPFTWETQPGTPKHALSDSSSLPPLTPPPAYHSRLSKGNSSMNMHTSRSSNFLIMRTLIMRIVSTMKNKNKNKSRHHHVSISPPYCSSSLSSSLSWSTSSSNSSSKSANYYSDFYRRRGSYELQDEHNPHGSWSFCFGLGKATTVKKTMFPIISRGSV